MAGSRPAAAETRDRGRRLWGFVLAAVGAAGLIGLFVVSNASGDLASRLAIDLGLAGSVLLSAIFQAMVVIGVWMAWNAKRRESRRT